MISDFNTEKTKITHGAGKTISKKINMNKKPSVFVNSWLLLK